MIKVKKAYLFLLVCCVSLLFVACTSNDENRDAENSSNNPVELYQPLDEQEMEELYLHLESLEDKMRADFIEKFFFLPDLDKVFNDEERKTLNKVRNPEEDYMTQAENLMTLSDEEVLYFMTKIDTYFLEEYDMDLRKDYQ